MALGFYRCTFLAKEDPHACDDNAMTYQQSLTLRPTLVSPYDGIACQMPVFGSRMHPCDLEMTRKSELCIHNKLIIFYAVLAVLVVVVKAVVVVIAVLAVPAVVVVDTVVADVIYDAIAATTTTKGTAKRS